MNDSITNQADYTPVGFKTKSVIEAEVSRKTNAIISTNQKMETYQQMELMGQLICSPKFNDYGLDEKVCILNEFAELKNIVNTFK
jgi:hypothetical protein